MGRAASGHRAGLSLVERFGRARRTPHTWRGRTGVPFTPLPSDQVSWCCLRRMACGRVSWDPSFYRRSVPSLPAPPKDRARSSGLSCTTACRSSSFCRLMYGGSRAQLKPQSQQHDVGRSTHPERRQHDAPSRVPQGGVITVGTRDDGSSGGSSWVSPHESRTSTVGPPWDIRLVRVAERFRAPALETLIHGSPAWGGAEATPSSPTVYLPVDFWTFSVDRSLRMRSAVSL